MMTSAYLALQLYLGEFRHIVVPFDQIFDAVRSGRADAGLIIHEGQLTYARAGFGKIIDLGEWWKRTNGLPLPLGGNVLRKDIPRDVQRDLLAIMRESIDYGLTHRKEAVQHSMPYRARHGFVAREQVYRNVRERIHARLRRSRSRRHSRIPQRGSARRISAKEYRIGFRRVNSSRIGLLFAAGFIAGLMNSIAGGGTIVSFPALILAGISSITANATSTVALLPGTLAGVLGYRQLLPKVWKWIRTFALVSLIGGLIGGILLTKTPERLFDRLVPFLILFATILFTAQPFFTRLFRLEAAQSMSPRWFWLAIVFQTLVSIYGGYFGAEHRYPDAGLSRNSRIQGYP